MEWFFYPAVIAAGFAAGFINTLAGSGSLITLPLLIFLGLPANIANGTNRVAILLQNVVAVGSFRRQRVLDMRAGNMLALPAVVGAVIGAQIAVNLDEFIIRRTVGILMVVMFFVVLIKPRRWLEGKTGDEKGFSLILKIFAFFLIGVYGGFIQAGVGIFLLAGLVLGAGYDLVRANAVKLLIVLCFTFFALIIFMLNGQVQWKTGMVLALGNMAGAWIASRMAVRRGAKFVRWFLLSVLLVSGSILLGLSGLLIGLFQ
ncbi:MAG: sulfite exporter TauE/SafE family protein [Candidatus Zixiibacteriota bacterium]|nr:MAG: sulfite exporter TauE/SafE family protein [candidate division Zixibacteria bacterium]